MVLRKRKPNQKALISKMYYVTQYKHDIDNRCKILVCHNDNFDVRVVAGEFVRAEIEIPVIKTHCTMQEGVSYCKITPKVYGH